MTDIDNSPQIGGYDADFVNGLPSEYECPICQLAFKDPVQLEECGHRFCQSCLNEIKRRYAKREFVFYTLIVLSTSLIPLDIQLTGADLDVQHMQLQHCDGV